MSDLKNHYQQIFRDLENHFSSNEEEKNYVLNKFQELSTMFIDVIDRLTYITEMRVKEIEGKQREIEEKISTVQKTVDGIENDIYEDDETYEFEIVCPYCNHEFVTDINSEISTEVECPQCHNMIELDWNDDETCGHECSHCEQECEEEEKHFFNDNKDSYKETNNHKYDEEQSDDIDSEYEEDEDIQEKMRIMDEKPKRQQNKNQKQNKKFKEYEDFEDDFLDEDEDDM